MLSTGLKLKIKNLQLKQNLLTFELNIKIGKTEKVCQQDWKSSKNVSRGIKNSL